MGGAVQEQTSDRAMDFGVVLTSAGVTLEWPPLPQFGMGVLDADPIRGLPSAHLPPCVLIAERCVVPRFLWRGADLVRECVGQTPVALVDLGSHFRAEVKLLGDALGAHRGRSRMRPDRSAPDHSRRPWMSLTVVVLMAFCFFFPETKARRPGWFALGRRTWSQLRRSSAGFPRLRRRANTSASVRSRTSARPRTAKPRAARSGRISPMARKTMERAAPRSATEVAVGLGSSAEMPICLFRAGGLRDSGHGCRDDGERYAIGHGSACTDRVGARRGTGAAVAADFEMIAELRATVIRADLERLGRRTVRCP